MRLGVTGDRRRNVRRGEPLGQGAAKHPSDRPVEASSSLSAFSGDHQAAASAVHPQARQEADERGARFVLRETMQVETPVYV